VKPLSAGQQLSPEHFMALRSLAKSRWVQGQKIEWRFNREWRVVSIAEVPALDAADRLLALGLVEGTVCCIKCEREVFQLTDSGREFVSLMDGSSGVTSGKETSASTVVPTPKAGEWFYHNAPKVWGRWGAARILATASCAEWLHAGNPDFTRWQRFKRNALSLAIFLAPGKLPLAIVKRPNTE
jgi:hypothetical protein